MTVSKKKQAQMKAYDIKTYKRYQIKLRKEFAAIVDKFKEDNNLTFNGLIVQLLKEHIEKNK